VGDLVALGGGKPSDPWAQIGIYTSLGFVLFGAIAGGYFLGWLVDDWLGTKPFFALVIAALGFAGGLIEIFRILARVEKRASGNNSSSGSDAR
jgi:ATP synthase protein I